MSDKHICKPDVEFRCPFCGGKVAASKADSSVLHSVPPCEKFNAMEPDDFLHACNAAMGYLEN